MKNVNDGRMVNENIIMSKRWTDSERTMSVHINGKINWKIERYLQPLLFNNFDKNVKCIFGFYVNFFNLW